MGAIKNNKIDFQATDKIFATVLEVLQEDSGSNTHHVAAVGMNGRGVVVVAMAVIGSDIIEINLNTFAIEIDEDDAVSSGNVGSDGNNDEETEKCAVPAENNEATSP
ncbi:uncharacterized protein [Eurosta solidaginis]|uniref:uncharacterized protein n=1 Tax=Eurosta solidaginis TaxID=178769 RepID=UPI0035306713